MIANLMNRVSVELADPSERAPEPIQGHVRARQVYAITRLTPVMMAANALNALAIVAVFALSGEELELVSLWAAVAIAAAGWFLWAWLRRSHRPFPQELGTSTVNRVVRNAVFLAIIWAFPSVALMPAVGEDAEAFLFAVAGGMTTGGVACFYPVPRAAFAYAVILVGGAVWGGSHVGVALLLGGITVAISFLTVMRLVIKRHAEVFISEIVTRAELEEKTKRVEALMAQTEAEARRISRESARRLEQAQKMEAVGQLTGGMAHDFNNILSVIRGNAELQRDVDEKDGSLINEIIVATERGADVINKLLAFARRQYLKTETTDIASVLRELTPVLERLLSERIVVSLRLAPDLWHVSTDRAQLQAALMNLAVNARDAMPNGGRLDIAARNRTLATAEALALSERVGHDVVATNYVAVIVRDDGMGMDEETAARAFEPFFTTKPVGQGTGLGLSMVLGFVRQSGGFVTLQSSVGKGLDITLFFPRAGMPAQPIANTAPEAVIRGSARRVLLVEDQIDVRRTLESMLRVAGYEVAEAGFVAEAEALLEEGYGADVVLSDVVLPGGETGFDLVRRLEDRWPDLPVILMSGYPDENGAEATVALRKPFSREALEAAIEAAFSRR